MTEFEDFVLEKVLKNDDRQKIEVIYNRKQINDL